METLGQFLRREREFRGISQEELCKATRINTMILGAIEEDRMDDLPKGTFVKGFLRSYAQHIGLNADEVLLRYQQLDVHSKIERDPLNAIRRMDVKKQIALAIVVLIVVIALATFLSSR